jgi:hypothetical protein
MVAVEIRHVAVLCGLVGKRGGGIAPNARIYACGDWLFELTGADEQAAIHAALSLYVSVSRAATPES